MLVDFANPTQVESLAILLRFSLDSEGDSQEEWCRQVLACFLQSGYQNYSNEYGGPALNVSTNGSSHQLKLILQIVRTFVENCEFKEQSYRGL